MPWNKTSTMDQKRLFIKDYIRGAFAMAELCRRYGISRPTESVPPVVESQRQR